MLRIYVVDRSAQSRSAIVQCLHDWMAEEIQQTQFLPQFQLRSVSPEEVHFLAAPDVLIAGPEILFENPQLFLDLRQHFGQSPCLAWIGEEKDDFFTCESLARQGCIDIFHANSDPKYFFRRLLVLIRGRRPQKGGKIILVDSGKGGVGVTSVVAGLAESLAHLGRSAVLIDTDTESQSLSRFLQIRPFLNENLQLLFEESRPLGEELVDQCLQSVWGGDRDVYCLAPPVEGEWYSSPSGGTLRSFVRILEIFDEKFDYILIDMAGLRGQFQQTLYRAADFAFFLLCPDPSSFFACLDKYKRCRAFLSPRASLRVVVNDSASWAGLPLSVLKKEFLAHTGIDEDHWCALALPYQRSASRWPGSGQTLASKGLRLHFESLLKEIGEEQERSCLSHRLLQRFIRPQKPEGRLLKEEEHSAASPLLSQRPRLSFSPALDMFKSPSAGRVRESLG